MRLNRRVPNGTHGGVRGRGLCSPSYSIVRPASACSKAVAMVLVVVMMLALGYPAENANPHGQRETMEEFVVEL